MAAIFGFLDKGVGRAFDTEAIVQAMQRDLCHRAPDGFTTWRGSPAVIGHGALNVSGADASPQPLRLGDGRILVADGFVANFDEVRKALRVERDVVIDDARLLAIAVHRWGVGFHERVSGEFAVALWNPESQVLDLFSDHIGARPLRYVETPQAFAFASEALALLAVPGISPKLDPVGIVTMWYDDAAYMDSVGSAFEDVRSLPGGHHLRWQRGMPASVRRYWRLQPKEPLRYADEREYVEAFRDVFGRAVTSAVRGSLKSALMLSGGIDSGAILAALRNFSAEGQADDLLCVSAVLGPENQHHATSQAEHTNIQKLTAGHRRTLQFEVPPSAGRDGVVSSADLAEVAWSWMHPRDMSLLVPSLCCRLARQDGCRVILNGVDGDVVTSTGRHYISGLVQQRQWRRVWHESREAPRVNTYLRTRSRAGLLFRAVAAGLAPEPIRRLRKRLNLEREIRGSSSHPEMSPEIAERIDLSGRLRQAMHRRNADRSEQHRCDNLIHWLSISLHASVDISSRHGIEARHPWCDRAVVEFFQRLPINYRTRDGWTKYIVRRACEPALGSDVVWHSGKDHLGAWLNETVLKDAASYLRSVIVAERGLLEEYVRPAAVSQALHLLNDLGDLTRKKCDRVLMLVSLAGWLRYIDQRVQ